MTLWLSIFSHNHLTNDVFADDEEGEEDEGEGEEDEGE